MYKRIALGEWISTPQRRRGEEGKSEIGGNAASAVFIPLSGGSAHFLGPLMRFNATPVIYAPVSPYVTRVGIV